MKMKTKDYILADEYSDIQEEINECIELNGGIKDSYEITKTIKNFRYVPEELLEILDDPTDNEEYVMDGLYLIDFVEYLTKVEFTYEKDV